MNYNLLKAEVKKSQSKVSFAHIVQLTTVKMNKGGTQGRPVNQFLNRVTKETKATIMLGNNYETSVNNRLKKTGSEETFKTEAMRGREWLEGFENLISVGNTENTKDRQYLRTYHNLAKTNTDTT